MSKKIFGGKKKPKEEPKGPIITPLVQEPEKSRKGFRGRVDLAQMQRTILGAGGLNGADKLGG